MSARDELLRMMAPHLPRTTDYNRQMLADAILREWLPTLAEDEAVVEAVARDEVDRHYRAAAWNTLSLDAQARWLVDHRRNLLALAAALTPPP